MREILFRGKRIENDKWVYGDLIQLGQGDDYWFIMPIGVSGEMYEDEPYPFRENDVMCRCALSKIKLETVGQFTGLTDKNGTKIFEGDIVGCFGNTQIFEIKWCNVRGGYFLDNIRMSGLGECIPECLGNLTDTLEVIDNIYDNPELLEAK